MELAHAEAVGSDCFGGMGIILALGCKKQTSKQAGTQDLLRSENALWNVCFKHIFLLLLSGCCDLTHKSLQSHLVSASGSASDAISFKVNNPTIGKCCFLNLHIKGSALFQRKSFPEFYLKNHIFLLSTIELYIGLSYIWRHQNGRLFKLFLTTRVWVHQCPSPTFCPDCIILSISYQEQQWSSNWVSPQGWFSITGFLIPIWLLFTYFLWIDCIH